MGLLVALVLLGQEIEFLASVHPSGADRKLVAAGHYLYSACERGLDIFDVTRPESITRVGHYDTPGIAYSCAVQDSWAFVADNFNALLVLDVRDPAQPESVASCPIGSVEEVTVRDTLAFCGSSDFVVVNVRNPREPRAIASIPNMGVRRIALLDSLAFVATQAGLKVVNIKDPARPRLDTVLPTSWLYDVKVRGEYVFVAGDTELLIYHGPTLARVGRYDAGYLAFGVAVNESLAVVCRGQQMNVHVVNIANLSSPVLLGQFATQNGPQSAALLGQYAYIGVWSRDLLVADLRNPRTPVIRGRVFRPGESNGAWRDGNLVAVADRWYGMSLVDVTDIRNPVERGSLALSGWPRRVVLRDSLAYVANYDGLAIVSVTDPDHPVQLGQLNTSYYTYELVVKDTIAYVAEREWNPYHGNLLVMSIADPRNPRLLGTYPVAGAGCEAVTYPGGNHVYVVCQGWSLNEFAVVSIADPANPFRVSGCNINGYPIGVACARDYAYVLTTSPTSNLQVLSVADTLNPQVVSTVPLPYSPRAVFVQEPWLLVSFYYYGGGLFDISNPATPALRYVFNTTGNPFGMYLDLDQNLYIADAHSLVLARIVLSGVGEPEVQRASGTRLVRQTLDLGAPTTGRIRIVDVLGRLVLETDLVQARAVDVSGLGSGVYLCLKNQGPAQRFVKLD
ncbi:MAG: hypothetical protein ABIK62_04430 [candidate division WOR-3 bacterium]